MEYRPDAYAEDDARLGRSERTRGPPFRTMKIATFLMRPMSCSQHPYRRPPRQAEQGEGLIGNNRRGSPSSDHDQRRAGQDPKLASATSDTSAPPIGGEDQSAPAPANAGVFPRPL